jgi:hypothetical protein
MPTMLEDRKAEHVIDTIFSFEDSFKGYPFLTKGKAEEKVIIVRMLNSSKEI